MRKLLDGSRSTLWQKQMCFWHLFSVQMLIYYYSNKIPAIYQLCSFTISCEWTSHTSSLCMMHSAFGILCLCKIKTKINPTHRWLFWLWKCFSINCCCHFITLVINKNSKQCDKHVNCAILFLLWKKEQVGNFWLLPSDLIQHHYVIQEGKILPSFPAFFWLCCYLYYIPLRYYLFISISLFPVIHLKWCNGDFAEVKQPRFK